MNVFLKQNGYEVIQVKPGSLATVYANDAVYFREVTFRIYSYPPGMGPPTTVWEESRWSNYRGEASIDNVPMPGYEGNYSLVAFTIDNNATMAFDVIANAPEPGGGGGGGVGWTPVLNEVTWEASSYNGPAKLVPFEFSVLPDQLGSINKVLVDNFLDKLKEEATKNNAQILKLRLWRDDSPWDRTNYKGELEVSVPAGFATPAWIAAILVVAVLGLVIYFVISPWTGQITDLVYKTTTGLTDLVWGPPDPDTGKRPASPLGLSGPIIAILAIITAIIIMKNRQGSKQNVKA
jgi:hypothetical protein